MPNFANATIMGHLGREPESRVTQSGAQVVNFTIACNTGFGDRKKTTWWKATCFGKTAEVAAKYLAKGDAVQVVGEPFADEWKDRDGNTRTSLCINVNQLVLLGEKRDEAKPVDVPPARDDAPFDDENPF